MFNARADLFLSEFDEGIIERAAEVSGLSKSEIFRQGAVALALSILDDQGKETDEQDRRNTEPSQS